METAWIVQYRGRFGRWHEWAAFLYEPLAEEVAARLRVDVEYGGIGRVPSEVRVVRGFHA